MKKKILLITLVLFLLFIVTGCGSKERESSTGGSSGKTIFVDMKYEEPKGYSNKTNTMDTDDAKTRIYEYDEENKSINLYYLKGKDYSYVEDESTKYSEKEINGTKWRYLTEEAFGIKYTLYYAVYNGALYQVELNVVDKYQSEYEEFMNKVSFK